MRKKIALGIVSLFVAAFIVNACSVSVYAGGRKSKKDASDKKEKKSGKKSGKNIVPLDSADAWGPYVNEGSSIEAKIIQGKKGDELELSYDMGTGTWVGIWTQIEGDLSKAEGIKIVYKGSGADNSFEFKLEDGDGSNFGTLIESKSNPSGWTSVDVLFSEIEYWWGGDENLDLATLKLHIAISMKDGDEGGSGKLMVKEVSKF